MCVKKKIKKILKKNDTKMKNDKKTREIVVLLGIVIEHIGFIYPKIKTKKKSLIKEILCFKR